MLGTCIELKENNIKHMYSVGKESFLRLWGAIPTAFPGP